MNKAKYFNGHAKAKAKYKFTDNDSIIDIMENIITDPKDLQQFKLAFKYPNGLPKVVALMVKIMSFT